MDEELKQYLGAMEERLLNHLDKRMDERFNGIDERFNGIDERFTAMEERLLERINDGETRLLRAFADYHTGWDARFKRIEVSDATIVERLAVLENRVLKLETKT